jgi:hypothetical protein
VNLLSPPIGMPRWIARAAIAATVLVLAGCQPASAPLPHEAYVWQRQWDDALRAALVDSRDLFGELHVLSAQFDRRRAWIDAAPDLPALAADRRPVTLVLRLEGSAGLPDLDDAIVHLRERVTAATAAGVRVRGVEIDHDCATARLADYAAWLQRLRAALTPELRLSATALPDWRDAEALEGVLAAVDATVLQVHAVDAPGQGLFDAERARAWIARWSERAHGRPFFVALPAYGVGLHLGADGDVVGVVAEQPTAGRAPGREIAADPVAVAGLLRSLEARRPAGLAGAVWFRLPRALDERAWALPTLRAVVRGEALTATLAATLAAQPNGALDLHLASTGTLDTPAPARIEIPGCGVGDGINGYRYEQAGTTARFVRTAPRALHVGRTATIGWVRCDSPEGRNVQVIP